MVIKWTLNWISFIENCFGVETKWDWKQNTAHKSFCRQILSIEILPSRLGLRVALIQEILVVYLFSCHKLKCGNELNTLWAFDRNTNNTFSRCSPKYNSVLVSYCLKNYTLFIGLLYPWSNVQHVRGYNFYCSVNLGENPWPCFNAIQWWYVVVVL